MYIEHLGEGVRQPASYTALILAYEIGDILKCMVYADRHGQTGYVGEIEIALADAHTMLGLLTEQLGEKVEVVRTIGLERYKEVQRNLSEGKGR